MNGRETRRQVGLFLLVAGLLCIVYVGMKSSVFRGPRISLERHVYDIGTVSQDSSTSVTLPIGNEGSAPLWIRRIQTGCNCTTHTMTANPIMPNRKESLCLSFNLKGRPAGGGRELAHLTTNDPTIPRATVAFRFNVTRSSKFVPGVLDLYLGDNSTQTEKKAVFYSWNDSVRSGPIRLVSDSPCISGRIEKTIHYDRLGCTLIRVAVAALAAPKGDGQRAKLTLARMGSPMAMGELEVRLHNSAGP